MGPPLSNEDAQGRYTARQAKVRAAGDLNLCLILSDIRLIAVGVRLVRAVDRDVHVVGLLLREDRELGAHGRKVQARDLLVELLREQVDLVGLVLARVALLPELEL